MSATPGTELMQSHEANCTLLQSQSQPLWRLGEAGNSQAACSWGSRSGTISWLACLASSPGAQLALLAQLERQTAFVCWLLQAGSLLLFAVCGLDLLNHPWSLLKNAGRGFFQLSWSWSLVIPRGSLQTYLASTAASSCSLILPMACRAPTTYRNTPAPWSSCPSMCSCLFILFLAYCHSVLLRTTGPPAYRPDRPALGDFERDEAPNLKDICRHSSKAHTQGFQTEPAELQDAGQTPAKLRRSSSMCVPLAAWNCCLAWPLSPALFVCSFIQEFLFLPAHDQAH